MENTPLSKEERKALRSKHAKAQNSDRHYTPGADAKREIRKYKLGAELTKMGFISGTYEYGSRSPSPRKK
jgi:hypothetical protein